MVYAANSGGRTSTGQTRGLAKIRFATSQMIFPVAEIVSYVL
jgi:hypothetical protein